MALWVCMSLERTMPALTVFNCNLSQSTLADTVVAVRQVTCQVLLVRTHSACLCLCMP